MKRITTIFALLIMMCMSSWAQPDVTGKTFTLHCTRGYVYYNGTQLAGTTDATQASEFAIVTYNSDTYLYDVTNNAFACHSTAATAGTTGNATLESNSDFSKAVKGLTWGNTNIATYPYYLEDSYGNWLNMDGSPKVYFNTWKDFESGNGGNTYAVEIVDASFDATAAIAMLDAYYNPSATVTYVISDASGVIYTSEAFAATIGATITELPADLQRPYCTYNVTSTTVVTGNNNVPVTVTYAPPFTVSSDFDNATWYYATLRGSKYLRADENAKDGNGRYQTSTTNEKTDVYKWAFVGNPYCLSIINKGAGSGKFLYAGDVPVMQAATPATDNKARWIASSNSNGGFNMRSESGANLYINDAGGSGNLGFWNSSWAASDNGSNWTITEVPATEITVTYNVVMGGQIVATASELQAVGGAPAVPADLAFAYTTYTYDVPEITASTTTVTATPTFSMPFTVSTDFDQATWYYLRGHSSYYSGSAFGDSRYVSTNGTATVWAAGKSYADNYMWAFIGNPIGGIQLINKASGNGYYLTDTDTQTSMTTTATNWVLKEKDATKFGLWSTNQNNYANNAGGTVKYWSSFDNGSCFWVEEVPAIVVNVTYELVVGGTTVNTVVVENVAANSAIDIPASLTTGYSTLAYDFTTSGTIGTTDCTITVTATLKAGIVLPTALSNNRAYKLHCERGDLATYTNEGTTYLASPCKTSLNITEGKKFAILNYENNLYLYSVDDQKFVTYTSNEIAPLAATVTGTSDAVAFTEVSSAVYGIMFDNSASKYLNSSASYTYGVVINNWGGSGKWDGGNQYVIYDMADFDPTTALAVLADYFHGTIAFNNAIAELETYPYGKGLNQYSLVVENQDYTTQAATIIDGLKTQGYSADNLLIAQNLLAGTSINLPTPGFYRIKGYSDNYITANTAASNASMNGTASASNIIYYNGNNLIFYDGGYGLYNTSIVAPVGSTLNEYTFSQGAQIGHYYVKSNFSEGGQYCYDNTSNGTKLDRNGSPVTSGSYQTDWTLEAVTELPVALNEINGAYYATLYLPVDVSIPAESKANTVAVNAAKDEAVETEITKETTDQTTKIPANTPVVLESTLASINATINTTGTAFAGLTVQNDLTGTLAAINVNTDDTNSGHYFLGKGTVPTGEVPGFFHWKGTVLKGFRAYLDKEKVDGGNPSKGLTLVDGEATAINGINAEQTDGQAIYNLQGQRVNKAQRGIYIVGGRKVVVK